MLLITLAGVLLMPRSGFWAVLAASLLATAASVPRSVDANGQQVSTARTGK